MRKGRNVLHTEKTCVTSCGYHWAARQTTKPPLCCVSIPSHRRKRDLPVVPTQDYLRCADLLRQCGDVVGCALETVETNGVRWYFWCILDGSVLLAGTHLFSKQHCFVIDMVTYGHEMEGENLLFRHSPSCLALRL